MTKKIPKGLVVSCQALENEPLHSSYIMSRMAVAANGGGALGIRSNSVEDINAISTVVNLPIIGIIKKDYEDSDVYITATMREVDALVLESKADVIAMDATQSLRPDGLTLDDFYKEIRSKYPNVQLMADCSTVEEAVHASDLGFDYIGTTLVGYTKQSKALKIEDNDFEIIRDILSKVSQPVIAEGNIDTPQKARRVLDLGCHSVVVGSIITRPQVITKRFSDALK